MLWRVSVTDAPRGLAVASVVDLAYAAIRERIVAGELARGERLHQEDLAVELGVSRTPVREALRRLAAERAEDISPPDEGLMARLRSAFG